MIYVILLARAEVVEFNNAVKRQEKNKNMFVKGVFISGLMFGVEYLWDNKILVLDLGIFRIYTGIVPKR